MARRSNLPKELKHLAWLTLDEEDGREYWNAMNLMGRYAAANHELIHRHLAKKVGARVILDIANHHHFANGHERDGGICQYTGRKHAPGEGNIDHVVPRSRGGASSWENCLRSHRSVNEQKAGPASRGRTAVAAQTAHAPRASRHAADPQPSRRPRLAAVPRAVQRARGVIRPASVTLLPSKRMSAKAAACSSIVLSLSSGALFSLVGRVSLRRRIFRSTRCAPRPAPWPRLPTARRSWNWRIFGKT